MNGIVPFSFEGAAVRAVLIDGEPHLVGKDVCERLGYADPTNAMKQHCRGVVKHHPIVDALGRTQEVRVLAEPDVLRLIIRSKLPAAERFERWVFEDVLPTIRKTGGYAAPLTREQTLAQAVLLADQTIKEQAAQLAVVVPKADAWTRIAGTDGSMCITDAAKTLQVRRCDLFKMLRSDRWIYQRQGRTGDIGYQDRINAGLLEHKTNTISRTDGTEKTVSQVRVTPKGLAALGRALGIAVNPAAPELPLA